MATFTPVFRVASEKVHCEHQSLLQELSELDAALDELACYSEVYANLAKAQQICRCGRHLAEMVPAHFGREEATVLATVAKVSPELELFARAMRQQHEALRARLTVFCRAVEELETAEDIDRAVAAVKEHGKLLACELSRHVALEEAQLGGFL